MGVGLDSGLQLDELSPALETLLDKADMAALSQVSMLLKRRSHRTADIPRCCRLKGNR